MDEVKILEDSTLNEVHSVHEEEYNDGIHGSHHIAIVDTCLDYNGEVFSDERYTK